MARNKRKTLEAARKHAQKGARDKALKEYEKLLKLDPRDAKLRLEIGDAYRRWGQLAEAIAAYTKVAEQYMDEGFDARAVAVFKQIQNLDPACWASYVPLAELYQRMGLTSEAIQSLQTAADGLNKAGQKHDALELLRKMASLDPSNTTSRIKVADLLRKEGLDREAIAEYEGAHDELQRQGSLEAAGTVLERILEIEPERPSALALMGRNLLHRELADAAEPFAKRAVAAEPDDPNHFELLADVYRNRGCEAELAETYRGLADLYRRRGDEDRARDIIQRFVPPEHMGAAAEGEAPSIAETGEGAGPLLVDPGIEELSEEVSLAEPVPPTDVAEVTVSDVASDAPDLGDDNAAGVSMPELGNDSSGGVAELESDGAEEVSFAEPSAAPECEEAGDAVELSLDVEGSIPELELDLEDSLADPAAVSFTEETDSEEVSLAVAVAAEEVPLAEETGSEAVSLAEAEEAPVVPAAEPDAGDPEANTEQELAEASVYLRYGKRDEALENLNSILARDPNHLEALEKLGEVHAAGEDADAAVGAWLRAGALAREAGDTARLATLHERVTALDAAAAAVLAPPTESEADPEESASGPAGAEVGEAVGADAPELSLADAAEESSLSLGASESTSAVTTKRIREDLEEAEFYRTQGLVDEAEAVYRRVLEAAPNHPLALVRMGELAAEAGNGASTGAFEPVVSVVTPGMSGTAATGRGIAPEAVSPLAPESDPTTREEVVFPDAVDTPEEFAHPDGVDTPEEVAFPDVVDTPEEIALPGAALPDVGEDLAADDLGESLSGSDLAPLLEGDSMHDLDAAELGGDAAAAFAVEHDDADYGSAADSFDLAAELSDALDEDGDGSRSVSLSGGLTSDPEQDVFSAVFAEFKKGVDKTLDAADYEAHYDLGIAYREMGLVEDAIAEFNTASQSPERRVACLHMLGLCCLELGRAAEAVEHLEGALGSGEVDDEQRLALTFDLGCALEAAGWVEEALAAWRAVAAADPTFCDVETRLAALEAEKPDDEAQGVASPEDSEDLESFDDLIAEAAAVSDTADAADSGEMSGPVSSPDPSETSGPVSSPDAPPAARKRRKKKISFV